MIEVHQTIPEGPSANGLQAAVASLFELPIWLVPNFAMGAYDPAMLEYGDRKPMEVPRFVKRLAEFADDFGYRIMLFGPHDNYTAVFKRGDLGIAVLEYTRARRAMVVDLVMRQVEWDPHPLGYDVGHQLGDSVSKWILFVALK